MDPAALTQEDLEMPIHDFATSRGYRTQEWGIVASELGIEKLEDLGYLEEEEVASVCPPAKQPAPLTLTRISRTAPLP